MAKIFYVNSFVVLDCVHLQWTLNFIYKLNSCMSNYYQSTTFVFLTYKCETLWKWNFFCYFLFGKKPSINMNIRLHTNGNNYTHAICKTPTTVLQFISKWMISNSFTFPFKFFCLQKIFTAGPWLLRALISIFLKKKTSFIKEGETQSNKKKLCIMNIVELI